MALDPVPSTAAGSFPEIPGYRLEGVLGRGATGTVYRAVQLAVEREVAIKVLHPELTGPKAVRRLQREARTTARLAHPGIVSAIDMGQAGGLWWYAMELVNGPALSTLLREKGKLSEREALRVFIPLCEALEHAHEQGVVHRDIKPANILVDGHGRARLVDLGLALNEDDPLLTRTGGTLGTPHYLSPEQARNPQSVDVRSDLWSLGATMFHALCGRPPFAGESVAEILSGVLYAHIPDPRDLEPSLSPGMALVLRKCLSRNPERRYANPSELLRDLEALRERRAVRVSARTLDPVAGESERRKRNLWIAAGVLLVAAAGGVLTWRPWAAAQPVDGVPPPSEAPWPLLDEILARSTGTEPHAAGNALAALVDLADAVPQGKENIYWNSRAALQARFESAIADVRQRVLQEYDRAITQERDFVRAASLVTEAAQARLEQELGANEAQRAAVRAKLDFGVLREQVAAGEKQALVRFIELLNAHYNDVVLPRVTDARSRGAWRDARALIQRDLRTVLSDAGISAAGLPAEKIDEELAKVRLLKVDSEVRAIESAWQSEDIRLERSVQETQRSLEDQLRRRELREDARAALDRAYQGELARRFLVREQMLVEVSDRAQAALEKAATQLASLQDEYLVEDARAALAAADVEFAADWRGRRYERVAASYAQLSSEPWLAPVHADLELRIAEARLLEDLLHRAADGLRVPGLDALLVGSILRTGVVEAGLDPLNDGFRLISGGRPEEYRLRAADLDREARGALLAPAGVERLAGLAPDPKDDVAAVDRLARALFRWREGDTESAGRVLGSGPLPRDSHGPLVSELEQRLEQFKGARSALEAQREDAARVAYNLIQRERTQTREGPERVRRISDLLTQYGDTSFVRAHEAELREMLTTPAKLSLEGQLRKAFTPTSLSLPSSNRAQLEYVCTAEDSPRWTLGDWRRGVEGWTAGRDRSREDLENDILWPRLILERPLDLQSQTAVEFEFEQPRSSGRPRRLIASVLGMHIGFEGAAEIGAKGRVAATSGGVAGLRELLERLDSAQGSEFAGLERDRRYVLRVELTQGRGKLTVMLDGEVLLVEDHLRPEGKSGSASLSIRSLEPVLLKAVRLEIGLAAK